MAISTAISPSQVARVVGIKTDFVNLQSGAALLPQRAVLVGQGNTASTYALTKTRVFTAFEVGTTYGFGSPLHLSALQLLPPNGDGVGSVPVTVYPLEDAGTGVVATGDITPSLTTVTEVLSFQININNILSVPFLVSPGDVVADIVTAMATAMNGNVNVPTIGADDTTELGVTSKWLGASANGITMSVDGPAGAGVTFAITQLVGGLNNPTVDAALAQIGNVWETMILNCLDIDDDTALDTYQTVGEGRWGSTKKKPFLVFTGNPALTPTAAIVIPEGRKTDRINCQLVQPGSDDLPFVTAGRQLARIVRTANDRPAWDYAAQLATGLTPGTDAAQWTDTQRDAAVKGGSSTVEVIDGVTELSDTVTFYHPSGEEPPAYRFVVDIVKVWQAIYNMALIFEADDWNGAPLAEDDQAVDPSVGAKKPRMAKSAWGSAAESLVLKGILTDIAFIKANIQAGISTTNPKRMDVATTIKITGNVGIISIDLNWGFFFGSAAVAA